MRLKYILLFAAIYSIDCLFSCKTKTDPNAEFIKQLTQRSEFTQSEKRIDSIGKKVGMPFKIGLDITTSSELSGDTTGNIAIAFIKFDRGMDDVILYIVKFDRKKQKIISVTKNKLGTSLKEYGWTDSTP